MRLAPGANSANTEDFEPDDRDEGIEDRLKARLDPGAATLEVALRSASTTDFVRALFEVLHPYVEMFRAILSFFEKAGAQEGRQQWNIQVDDVDLGLEHFRRFLRSWDEIECDIDAPAVDQTGAWRLFNETRDMPEMQKVSGYGDYLSGVRAIDSWLEAYRANRLEPLPASLAPGRLGPGFDDTAAIAAAALTMLREASTDRKRALDIWRSRRSLTPEQPRSQFDFDFVAQNETDYWIGTIVARLARAQSLPRKEKSELGRRLAEHYRQYPRRKFGVRLGLSDLTSILSLPIWKKRHELYAVWIGTEILNAIPDHDCEIHHDGGRIEFAFRETVLATIHSSAPIVRLISERRVKLDAPVGKHRVGAVQPDYGLWRGRPDFDRCTLVVEVKHYKRSSNRSFSEVLQDYARAFPKAEVFLVNHGPVGLALSDLPPGIAGRCHTVENLTADHSLARERLREAVRQCIGPPVQRSRQSVSSTDMVLAVDVSPSMSSCLHSLGMETIIGIAEKARCTEVAAIDTEVRTIVPLETAREALRSLTGHGTSLQGPIRELLETYARILVVTDNDGVGCLAGFSTKALDDPLPGLRLVEVAR